MRDRIITAVMIAAALLYLWVVCMINNHVYPREYKDVYEQMRMEQMIM